VRGINRGGRVGAGRGRDGDGRWLRVWGWARGGLRHGVAWASPCPGKVAELPRWDTGFLAGTIGRRGGREGTGKEKVGAERPEEDWRRGR